MSQNNPPPKPRFHLMIDIGASELPRLLHRLREEADALSRGLEGQASLGEGHFRGFWGGAGTHGHYEITDAGGPSAEVYDQQLLAWRDRKREEREAKQGKATP